MIYSIVFSLILIDYSVLHHQSKLLHISICFSVGMKWRLDYQVLPLNQTARERKIFKKVAFTCKCGIFLVKCQGYHLEPGC